MTETLVVVEDDRELRSLLEEVLREADYTVRAFASSETALAALDAGLVPDLVLTDLMLPGISGADLLKEIRARLPGVNVLIMTAFGSIESAITLVKAGASDYLTKPLGTDHLLHAVATALEESRPTRQEARTVRARTRVPPEFVGDSPPMLDLYALLERASVSPHPALVTGESGTGKELVARALHRGSGRGAFVIVNCGALPEHLLESELFGHERGAFTGADRTKDGLFHVAHGGTLFLDEIGELPRALQPKLLRALEQGEIRRVGATTAERVDVRLIAATNRNLEAEVTAGRFREDLFWRLNVITIEVPALRERPEDIPALVRHFLGSTTPAATGSRQPPELATETLAVLLGYPWPGNVRELRNAILRALALTADRVLLPEHLPPRIRLAAEPSALVSASAERQLSMEEVERLYILQILRQVGGNKTRAADLLGLDRKTLYRKLDEYRRDESAPPESV